MKLIKFHSTTQKGIINTDIIFMKIIIKIKAMFETIQCREGKE